MDTLKGISWKINVEGMTWNYQKKPRSVGEGLKP